MHKIQNVLKGMQKVFLPTLSLPLGSSQLVLPISYEIARSLDKRDRDL